MAHLVYFIRAGIAYAVKCQFLSSLIVELERAFKNALHSVSACSMRKIFYRLVPVNWYYARRDINVPVYCHTMVLNEIAINLFRAFLLSS